ncbi:MAG: hypothetical protein WCD20_06155 [Rhodomicrobium sp.]
MQGEPVKRRYPKFQIRPAYIGAIVAAFLLDYMHPEMHFMVAIGVCMLSIATEAGLVLAQGRFPGSLIAKVLIVATAYVLVAGAWYLIGGPLFKT